MVKEVLKTRRYKAGYEVRTELIDGEEFGCPDFEMKSAYTHTGDYIGNSRDAYRLCRTRGVKPEKAAPDHNVCSIGFCEREQKWLGWSHRAICSFGVGDKLFEEGYGDDHTPFKQHGSVVITTLDQARQAAIAFAESVS